MAALRSHADTFSLMRRASFAASAAVLVAAIFVLPGLLDPFRLNLLGKYLCFALVALGLDLLWGYAGQLSLGQSVFFGLGAYIFGMYLKLESSGGKLPDFMTWSGLTQLPAFWQPFANPVIAFSAAIVIPGVLGAALGYLLSRSRIVGVYFAIITQALAFIATTLFIGQQPFTGGTNGLTNFATIFGQPLHDAQVQVRLFQVTALVLAGCLAFTLWLSRSRFGRLLVALRDDEQRVRFSGYNPTFFRAVVFGLAAALAGLGGALFVPQVGIVNPDSLGIILGIQMVIWVAVGGRGTLFGAVVGAIVVNAAQTAVSESFPDVWQYGIGVLFVATVLLFPRGLVGGLQSLRFSAPRRPHAAAVHAPEATEVAA
ncbi:MAG TPA: urea ABC transporter permease subunit UrtC [Chloroflexota bacterium]